jgi:hypothetical protein
MRIRRRRELGEQGKLSGVYKRYMGEGIDKVKREGIKTRGEFVGVN